MQTYIILASKVFISFASLLIISGFISVIFIDVLMDNQLNRRKVSLVKKITMIPFSIGFSLGIAVDKIFNISGDYEEEQK